MKRNNQPDPLTAPALFQSAIAAHQAGRLAEAEDGYRKTLSRDSNYADAFHMLGIIHKQKGKLTEAESLIRQALSIRTDAAFLGDLGMLLQQTNRLPEAEAAFRSALAMEPNFGQIRFNLGVVLQRTNRLHEAEAAYRRTLDVHPDHAYAHRNLGKLLAQTDRLQEAEAAYCSALALKPDFDDVYNSLGNLFKETARLREAEAAYRRALELSPHNADAHYNLGNLLQETDRCQEAEIAYRRALAARPNSVEIHYNLGNLLKAANRLPEAEACFRRALELAPTGADIRYNLGLLLLAQGRYAEAWPFHESRYDLDPRVKNNIKTKIPDLPFPQWRGEPLAGKSLLIWPEQGLGDTIQFARYVPLLRNRGVSRLTMVCAPPLAPLIETIEGVDEIITELAAKFSHDYWSFPFSLPLYVGTTIDTIPNTLPYLHAHPQRVERWRARLPAVGTKVGLVWKGNANHKNDLNRSLPGLDTLAPLWNVSGISFISVQKGQGEEEANQAPAAQPLIALGHDVMDFADTAAIVAQLDLVICVDTAIAHVAGALGKPCWVLLPAFRTDWRWLLDRPDSPWYPGVMRLFRQSKPGEWGDTISAVVIALENWVSASGRNRSAIQGG